MHSVISFVLVWTFVGSLTLFPLSRVPELAAHAPLLLIAAAVLCLGAGTGLVLLSTGRRRL